MIKKNPFVTICVLTTMILTINGTSQALPTTLIDVQDFPSQDTLQVPWNVHELGNFFPPDELIASDFVPDVAYTPCIENFDDPQIPNPLVYIQNLSTRTWTKVWYVADAPDTLLANYDGLVNLGLAFQIDSIGANQPLVYEKMTVDNIFEPGEIWGFVIQDYFNAAGLPPSFLGSPGVGIFSSGLDQVSSGSIIAIPAPGAILLGGIGVGLTGWLRRRRTL